MASLHSRLFGGAPRGRRFLLEDNTMTTSTARTTKLPLEFPIEWKGVAITELSVRRPKGADMRFLPKGDEIGMEGMFPFFALLTGVEEQFLDEIDAADITALGELVNGFLAKPKRRK
jgi:hypothetical protein